ncbi:ArsR/SmtB family transcription factor [Streptomyces lycii]|uniref:Winged helix-turn-helix transcriptional regulator n=1 Tax=Streptomyces lycii TaxID=2654337 RepID=A0ABQ7FKE7_9ACTN|nr:winged helix-turn-helix domain-containing protein [Streptomyces lycii]KAF4408824.1 winged helix-turn-helix transcriptional regulator [Streptomyces lycii]
MSEREAESGTHDGHTTGGRAEAEEVLSLDPRSLRGLAHPLRIRLLEALREHGPATASRLAARLGESSGATSYHLRQLAAHGFVVDDPERGTGRERWWKAAHRGTKIDRLDAFMRHTDPAVRGAISTLMHEVATIHAQELNTWLGTMHDWPEEWRSVWELSDYSLRLTPDLAREMAAELHNVVEGYRARAVTREETGSAPVRVHVHAFPRAEGQQATPDRGTVRPPEAD